MKCTRLLPKEARRIGIVGLGRSNLSLLELLPKEAVYVLRSDGRVRREDIPKDIRVGGIFEGKAALSDITEDALILSPSVRRSRPELLSALGDGVILSSDAEIFFENVSAPVLAVSGSSGKSTTATLAHMMLGGERCGAVLAGNVGTPMTSTLRLDGRVYVCELSSFMLEYHRATVRRSVLTGITENHLDWHGSFDEYREAKLKLFALSGEFVANVDDKVLGEHCRGRGIYGAVSLSDSLGELVARQSAEVYMTFENGWLTRNGERLLHESELLRRERHNIANMLCALALVDGFCDRECALDALRRFGGLVHRGRTVCEAGGVKYIDSSIDTTPERCVVTLSSIEGRGILLLGGRGKGLSYDGLARGVSRFARLVITFGEERERLRLALCDSIPTVSCERLRDAVFAACAEARRGEAVVLSPACTSYDEFGSFEERGELFEKWVSEYVSENKEK